MQFYRIAGMALCCLSGIVFAEERPLWEAGAGLSLINFPHYRGADQRNTFLLPFPYIIYRGDVVKLDGQKIRGLFFDNDRFQLDVSLSGSTPSDSADNDARKGMPDLDPTFELGPSLMYNVGRTADRRWELDLRFPFRAVFRTDLSYLKYTGWIFHPHVNLDLHDGWPGPGWNWGVSAGPLISDGRYHRYFYNVESKFATAQRPAYSTDGGYSGLRVTGSLSKRFPKFWVGAFLRYDGLAGAKFEDSPLVKRKNDVSFGLAVAWIFSESSTKVEAKE
jgi:MipA family protein